MGQVDRSISKTFQLLLVFVDPKADECSTEGWRDFPGAEVFAENADNTDEVAYKEVGVMNGLVIMSKISSTLACKPQAKRLETCVLSDGFKLFFSGIPWNHAEIVGAESDKDFPFVRDAHFLNDCSIDSCEVNTFMAIGE